MEGPKRRTYNVEGMALFARAIVNKAGIHVAKQSIANSPQSIVKVGIAQSPRIGLGTCPLIHRCYELALAQKNLSWYVLILGPLAYLFH